MPPQRKGTRYTRVIEDIITTEDISKSDNHVSNQGDPQGFAAAVRRRGGRVAISAKERGGADSADLPNTNVSIRSSKQKALHKILSMDIEDADDCESSASALKADAGETSNDCLATGATAGPKHTNKKKQGPRVKKAKKGLETIPEDVAMETHFVEPSLMIVSTKATPVSELHAKKEKPDREKRRGVHANENDQCNLRTQQEEEQQGNGSQQGEEQQGNGSQQREMITCHKASKKRGGSSLLAPGHSAAPPPNQAPDSLSKKTVDCLSMPMEKLDSFTQALAKPEPKKDQLLNVRSSTRTKKVIYYSEQSPEIDANEKRVFMNTESMAPAASKRNDSAAKLLPRGVKRVKEDPTSTSEGPLGLGSARATCVKRGRRHQESNSPQNPTSNSSTASTETGNKEEHKKFQEERNLQQINSASANNMDLDKGFRSQTAQPESFKFLPAQEGAKLVSFTGRKESDRIARNQVIQNMAEEPTSFEGLSETAGKSVAQNPLQDSQLISHRKKSNTSKGRKVDSKRRALPDAGQQVEDDLLDALPLASGDEAKHKVLEAVTRRNTSSANLPPRGAKMVKENPVNAQEETVELESGRATCVRRGRRHQNLGSLQNLADTKLVAFINRRGTDENSEAANTFSASLNSVDLDNASLLQTGRPEPIKFSPTKEGMMHGKGESDHIASNQDQMMAEKLTGLEELSIGAGKNDKNKLTTAKGRKINSRQKALLDTAQNDKGDLLSALPLGSGEEAKPKVLEGPLVEGGANSMTDAKPNDKCGTHQSADADRNFNCELQNRGRNTSIRKRSLQGTAQHAKKQKFSALDTLSLPSSLDMLVEGAVPAQNEKVIQKVETEDLNAVDLTNSKSRIERSSEKQRKEERKRKRAMKFDALPVGFGLGISCWSTPPWAEQSLEEEVAGEEDLPVMGFQVEPKSLMEEAKKQQCLQETAMPKDAENINTPLRLEETSQEMESSVLGLQVQPNSPMEEAKKRLHLQEIPMSNDSLGVKDSYLVPPCSATRLKGSSFSNSDAEERLPASGLKSAPTNDSNHQQGKAKAKRQVARKTTKASKAVLLELPPAVYTGSDNSIVDKENVEPKLHAHNKSELKTSRNSRRRIATTGMEKTTRTRRK